MKREIYIGMGLTLFVTLAVFAINHKLRNAKEPFCPKELNIETDSKEFYVGKPIIYSLPELPIEIEYEWTFDGKTVIKEKSPAYAFTSSGTKRVTVNLGKDCVFERKINIVERISEPVNELPFEPEEPVVIEEPEEKPVKIIKPKPIDPKPKPKPIEEPPVIIKHINPEPVIIEPYVPPSISVSVAPRNNNLRPEIKKALQKIASSDAVRVYDEIKKMNGVNKNTRVEYYRGSNVGSETLYTYCHNLNIEKNNRRIASVELTNRGGQPTLIVRED